MLSVESWIWVGLGAAGVIIVYCVAKLVRGWLRRRRDGLGKRVDDLEQVERRLKKDTDHLFEAHIGFIRDLQRDLSRALDSSQKANLRNRVDNLEETVGYLVEAPAPHKKKTRKATRSKTS